MTNLVWARDARSVVGCERPWRRRQDRFRDFGRGDVDAYLERVCSCYALFCMCLRVLCHMMTPLDALCIRGDVRRPRQYA